MKAPELSSQNWNRGVPAFLGKGFSREESDRRESEIFDELAQGAKPVVVAAKANITVPTVYAIDKREAKRRGVEPNLARRTKEDAPGSDTATGR